MTNEFTGPPPLTREISDKIVHAFVRSKIPSDMIRALIDEGVFSRPVSTISEFHWEVPIPVDLCYCKEISFKDSNERRRDIQAEIESFMTTHTRKFCVITSDTPFVKNTWNTGE